MPSIVTVTLNPAVDRVIEAAGFRTGGTVKGKLLGIQPAGKALNVSRVLASLGARSIATGFVGADEEAMFEKDVREAGSGRVVMQFLAVGARTRENITIIDTENETETHIRSTGFVVHPEDLTRIRSKVSLLARRGVTMVFSGSLPAGLSADEFSELVALSVRYGARVVVDAEGAALEAAITRKLWVIHMNRDELGTLVGEEVTDRHAAVRAAKALRERAGAVEWVAVTLGAEGAVLVGPTLCLTGRVDMHPTRVVNTVGSGDSFLAGLLESAVRVGDWRVALRGALAAASANVVSKMTARVRPEDVHEFREAAVVEVCGGE